MPRHAPTSMLIWAGSGTACSEGSTIHSAAVPKGRRHWPFQTQTRSPTRAHAVNLAGAVAVRNDAGESDLARQPRAAFDVGRVDAGGGEAHPDLTPFRLRRLQFRDPQYVAGRSVRLVIGSAHGCSLAPLRPLHATHDDTEHAARRLRPPSDLSRQDVEHVSLAFDVCEGGSIGTGYPGFRARGVLFLVTRVPPSGC